MINTFKTEALGFGFFMLLLCGMTSCTADKKLTAQQIVERSVEAHGGIKAWNDVNQLSFTKAVTLFNDKGEEDISTTQFQLFRMQPTLFGKLEWEQDGYDMMIVYEDDKISKFVNDSLVTNQEELSRARDNFFAAYHVTQQPFALLEDDVTLTHKGEVTIEDKALYEIHVTYADDTKDSDQWIYYIDTETFEVVANKVVLPDHTSWIDNVTYDLSTDFKLNAHRKSYRINELGEKLYLRAEYHYSDYHISY